ncbi:carbamoyltransferase HypF [Streptomyces sp. VRA16 Mangrove soil]|uniref:carbamoyltransferase HypF n=1 Tax=Streptomyces sp. VRA16 Mangrove soil TaxID=2817434 RepID=UPI001A9F6687|nr:carbamoyltransferase HypF [Streptomyces sp. VRA16 Mangrove soil]MBO1334417.1 carbamoyltransferase HypF [Streptomyces sp. VRA16 Mangrove soil]
MARTAREFAVTGIVQGVGFRPFVHRTAARLGLDGWVANVDGSVHGAVAGEEGDVDAFARCLSGEAPPLARVRRVALRAVRGRAPARGSGFTVRRSEGARTGPREIPPDAATCEACLAELFDPHDRRHRYPFINCTGCGPRATIVEALPYDRVRTTMRRFPMCAACAAEYADPADRRFHAEPIACPACGPRLSWDGLYGDDALRAAVKTVESGGIVAVKGLGGYQLVCDATDAGAVAALRARKHRPTKPFAVMVSDLAAARRVGRVGSVAAGALSTSVRPVVLVAAGPRPLPADVHPGSDRIGLFLPTTGLHHLLLHALDRPLVVTSGNTGGEPIAVDEQAAHHCLDTVADGFLDHDRPIRARHDDSVVQPTGRGLMTIRRARGLAPAALPLPRPAPVPLVAAGAQLKHTFALAEADRVHLSPHTGDLASTATYDAFLSGYDLLRPLVGIEPRAVAHDLHPGYLSTQWARARPLPRVAVQHHHAHLAACAAEHGLTRPFTGVAYDGLGLGDDGTLWGGEVMVADLAGYRRVARFGTAALPGGDAAVRHPWRTALGYLHGAEPLGSPPPERELTDRFAERLDPAARTAIRAMIARDVNCPRVSSAGRLFDAVAALLGLADEVTYEGEAAVRLEVAAGRRRGVPLVQRIVEHGQMWVYDPVPTLADLLRRQADGEPVAELAAAFHRTLADVTAELVARAVDAGAPRTVCLAGGCFVNRRLLADVRRLLRARGLRVLVGRDVPVGDGGIAYGQAAVAAARLTRTTHGRA